MNQPASTKPVIIFDFFDVFSPDYFKAWLQEHGFKREGNIAHAAHLVDVGKITMQEFTRLLANASGKDMTQFTANIACQQVDHELVDLVARLHKSHRLGLLSNAQSDFLRDILRRNNLEQHFDIIAISGEIGHAKPSPEAFHFVMREMQSEPHEIIFIDDNPANVTAANNLGIRGVRYINLTQLRHDLASIEGVEC